MRDDAHPPEPATDLRADLRAAVEATRAASSAFRPAVAEYLYSRGLAPLYDALAAEGEVAEALVTGVWRLMLSTVATRRFGVSTDDWRAGDYPERYFPLVWLDLLPRWLPRTPAADRASAVAALFNLGEQLPRAAANPVAERLVERGSDFARAPIETLRAVLVELGLVDRSVATGGWTRLVEQPAFDCAAVDPAFLPGVVVSAPDRRFIVIDALRPVALHLSVGPDGLACRARGAAPPAVEARRTVEVGPLRVMLQRRTLRWSVAGGDRARAPSERALYTLPLQGIAPAALAANGEGDVLIVDAASTRVRWLRAVG